MSLLLASLVVMLLLAIGAYEAGLAYGVKGGAIAEVREAIEPVRLVENDEPVD